MRVSKIFVYLLFGYPMFQLYAIIKRGQSHSPDVNSITVLFNFDLKGHPESCNKIGTLSPAEHLLRFEPETLLF